MSNNTQPEIRFPGFTEDWEERKLGQVANYRRGSFPQPYGNKEWYDGENSMPFVQVVDVGDNLRLVEDTKQKISELAQPKSVFVEEGKVVVTLQGSIGRVAITQYPAYVDRTLLIFESYKAEMDEYYFAYVIQQLFEYEKTRAPGGTIKTITKEALSNFTISFPSIAEQKKLGKFFEQLDDTITLHQRKLDLLKETKKGFLQKMFPKNGAKVPEVRFPGFTEDWEERKFGLLFEKNLEKNKNSEFDASRTISIATMHFKEEGNGAAESSLATYKVLRVGDIAYEGHTSKQFAFGRFVLNDIGDGIMSPRFTTLRPTSERPISFWKQYIHYEPIMRHLLVRSTKNGTMMNELVIPDLEKESLLVPSESEQKQIGAFFDKLDETITLHQRKLDLLKETKKGFLQKMFV